MKLHGKHDFPMKCQLTKNKERPIIELGEGFPTFLMVPQTELRFVYIGELEEEEKALNIV